MSSEGHEVPKGMVRIKLETTKKGKVIEVFVPAKKKPKTRR